MGRIKQKTTLDEVLKIPDLMEIQKASYKDFLMMDIPPDKRKNQGLQEVFNSVFPISDYNGVYTLQFVGYEFGKPKYNPEECIIRGETYGAPLKGIFRLVVNEVNEKTKEVKIKEAKEQTVHLCDMPLMTDRGTFIINGAERVVVSQLHRSPGISFETKDEEASAIKPPTYTARIVPYRGTWIEIEYDNNNEIVYIKIDRKKRFLLTTFLRGLLNYTTEKILEIFFKDDIEIYDIDDKKLKGKINAKDIINKETGEVLLEAGWFFGEEIIDMIKEAKIKKVYALEIGKDHVFREVVETLRKEMIDKLKKDIIELERKEKGEYNNKEKKVELKEIINEMKKLIVRLEISENTSAKEKALKIKEGLLKTIFGGLIDSKFVVLDMAKKLRPGDTATLTHEAARQYLRSLFFNSRRYNLGAVGRYKINKTLYKNKKEDLPDKKVLVETDIIETIKKFFLVNAGKEEKTDIDHLGNRRVRSVGELVENQFRVGLLRIERMIREKMMIVDKKSALPANLINPKPLAAVIKEFFGSSQLSQFMDQINPLAELTHKRRISALGPGGLSRERAGFEVRDVHYTHYGRLCPIETPEGQNIGLISSLATYARVNKYGFIETPYRKVKNGKVTDEIEYLTADKEDEYKIGPADIEIDENGRIKQDVVLARHRGDFPLVPAEEIDYIDVSPKQLVSVSASLIPFLEHDDANRALMGSNMQRQAVPLLKTEAPYVGTGMERKAALDSGRAVLAKNSGEVIYVDSDTIIIKKDNFVGESLKDRIDIYRLKKFKRTNQNTTINEKPIVKLGDRVKKGDIIADGPSMDKGELALGKNVLVAFMPWFGYNYEDAIVISERLLKDDVYTSVHIEELEVEAKETKLGAEEITRDIPNVGEETLKNLDEHGIIRIGAKVKPGDILVGKVTPISGSNLTPEEKLLRAIFGSKADNVKDTSLRVDPGIEGTVIDIKVFSRKEKKSRKNKEEKKLKKLKKERDKKIEEIKKKYFEAIETIDKSDKKKEEKEKLKEYQRLYFEYRKNEIEEEYKMLKQNKGDDLPPGVIKRIKISIAQKRKISVGDKLSGRHGNKGVISKILPVEDMPYLKDGTPVDMVLNPLGVPSRMNVGQLLETQLGFAAKILNLKNGFETPVFNGMKEKEVKEWLKKAGLDEDGKTILYNGQTGEPFKERVTVGVMYILKLNHMVDDKIHARSTGPYSLVTQQPLGGKAQLGGQRFGEMEVWALEAYGAAYTLQEMLTLKSDDVEGRRKLYEAIARGKNIPEPGIPESFNVLVKELQGLALNIEIVKKRKEKN